MSTDRLLFDAPGPRGRRQIRIATAVSSVVIGLLIAAAIRQFAANGQLDWNRWQPFTNFGLMRFLFQGLVGTAEAAIASIVFAMTGGIILALGRLSSRRLLRWPSYAYVEIMRTIPALLLIYVMLFALPRYGFDLPVFWKLVIPLSFSSAASFAVIFRAGILSLDKGQGEAGLAIGLTYSQTMRYIVMPQAVRSLLPAIISQSVGLLKDTSLGYIVSYNELLFSGQIVTSFTHRLIQTYIIIAAIYLVVNGSLSKVARTLEARQRSTLAPGRSVRVDPDAV
jgi:glutamate transport system permease protein